MAKFDQEAFNKAVAEHDKEQKQSGNSNQDFGTGGANQQADVGDVRRANRNS